MHQNGSSPNPFILIILIVIVGGAIVGLNRVSIWFPPGFLVVCLVGIAIVAIVQTRAAKRDEGAIDQVDHARIASMSLTHFAPWLKENVRGHDDVIDAITVEIEQNLRLAKSGSTLGAYLLVGPTGTGKTFLSQLVGQALFSDSEPIILQMNQYKNAADVYTLIGPPPGTPGYEVGGTLTRPILENHYRVVVFDEIEKAHQDLQHCLYGVLDEGSCREKSSGKYVDFSGTVFFGTCNAGVAELRRIRSEVDNPAVWLGRSRDALVASGGFDKAFLARWNGIYLMDELEPIHVAEVACLQLAKHWREYGIEVTFASPEIILDAVQKNEEFKQYGVRQLGAYLRAVTQEGIIRARQEGKKTVRLGVDPEQGLMIDNVT